MFGLDAEKVEVSRAVEGQGMMLVEGFAVLAGRCTQWYERYSGKESAVILLLVLEWGVYAKCRPLASGSPLALALSLAQRKEQPKSRLEESLTRLPKQGILAGFWESVIAYCRSDVEKWLRLNVARI